MEGLRLRVKGIILDLDGTIVDSREAYLEAAKAAFALIGPKKVAMETAIEIPRKLERNLPIDSMIEGIDTQKFLRVYFNAYHKATVRKTRPIPGIPETLETLSQKTKLALVTMRRVPREKVKQELRKFSLADYFQLVVTALETDHPKPSPEALAKCAKHLGIQINECAMVGDSTVDVRAGRNAGTKTVAVLSGIFTEEELETEKPDLILKNVNELPYFIE